VRKSPPPYPSIAALSRKSTPFESITMRFFPIKMKGSNMASLSSVLVAGVGFEPTTFGLYAQRVCLGKASLE